MTCPDHTAGKWISELDILTLGPSDLLCELKMNFTKEVLVNRQPMPANSFLMSVDMSTVNCKRLCVYVGVHLAPSSSCGLSTELQALVDRPPLAHIILGLTGQVALVDT